MGRPVLEMGDVSVFVCVCLFVFVFVFVCVWLCLFVFGCVCLCEHVLVCVVFVVLSVAVDALAVVW